MDKPEKYIADNLKVQRLYAAKNMTNHFSSSKIDCEKCMLVKHLRDKIEVLRKENQKLTKLVYIDNIESG